MSLPLLDRAVENDPLVRFTPDGASCRSVASSGLIPDQPPAAGEQYRFHFDMTKCIGCRCCEVACAEQNGNPTGVNWRRVGEIEGGEYPNFKRFYLSMGCNHCLDAACLKGCPVDAYSKDALTGLVLHSADACIGCGYCTWNCPYGVPQFDERRGVVGKCDMCHNRLADGLEPACVNACPEGAISIEVANLGEWRSDFAAANAPGMPPAENTISTTRITLPEDLPATLRKADYHRVRPEHPHWPLVLMLVLTQLSVGVFLTLAFFGTPRALAALAALGTAAVSLGAATFHLGRPAYAYRALRMWRRSWLSREVLLFSLFAGAASAYSGALLLRFEWALQPLALATAALGFAGITASAYIYLVPARPAWHTKHTVVDFYLTALVLGPLLAAALGVQVPAVAIAAAAGAQALNHLLRFLKLARSEEFELRASARLLATDLERWFTLRWALLVTGGMILPLAHFPAAALTVALAGELVSRWLFFVSVVPRNMAASFLGREAA